MIAASTFSGAGGLDLGLARAGYDHAFFAEADHYRRRVLAAHWPGVPTYDDVRSVATGDLHEQLAVGRPPGPGEVDVLCGGFPCQDVSVAGKRAGLAGARTGLFFEFTRIAAALEPRWLLLENVPGLLSSNDGRDFGVVLDTLVGLGYGVAWRTLDARYFGVPQRRRRVFIVGHLGGDGRSALLALCDRCPGSPRAGDCTWQEPAARAAGGAGGGRVAHALTGHHNRHDGTVDTYVVAGCASEMDVAAPLLNANAGGLRTTDIDGATWVVTEPVATPLSAGSASARTPGRRLEDDTNLAVAPTLRSHPRPGSNSDGAIAFVKATKAHGPDDLERWEQTDLSAAMTSHSAGLPASSAIAFNVTPAGHGQGSELAATEIDTAPSVSPQTGSYDRGVHLANDVAVRRLTPTECERLMSWPDGWTAPAGVDAPDTSRYSACGDGVVANVAEWIGRRITAVEALQHG